MLHLLKKNDNSFVHFLSDHIDYLECYLQAAYSLRDYNISNQLCAHRIERGQKTEVIEVQGDEIIK